MHTVLPRYQLVADRPNNYPLLCGAGYLATLEEEVESEEVVETRPKTQVFSAQVKTTRLSRNVGAAIGPAVDSATAYESLPASSKRRTIVLTAFRVSPAARPIARRMLEYDHSDQNG
jgi:hypothetical protein